MTISDTALPRPIRSGDRVVLIPSARAALWKYGDVGTRTGTVIRIDGWPVMRWTGADDESWVPKEDLEIVP